MNITFRVSARLFERLAKLAKREGMSAHQMAQRILEEWESRQR